MGASRSITVVVLLTAAILGAACSGGDDDGDASDESSEENSTERRERDEEGEGSSSSYRAEGTLEVYGFEDDVTAVVADPATYALTFVSDGGHSEEIRVGQLIWTRSAPDAGTADQRQWIESDVAFGTAVGSLEDLSLYPPPDDEFVGATGADLAGNALVEVMLTAPRQLVDIRELDAAETELQPDLPPDIASALERLSVEPPDVELSVRLEEKVLVEATLEISSPGVDFELHVTYSDHGLVAASDVVAPDESQVDPTPWVDEEALAAFRDAELIVPSAPPAGLVLVGAHVIDAGFTPEGCPQVELAYDSPPDQPPGDRYLTLYVLPKDCATTFDPTPFDQTLGGLPSRFDGYEVIVGTSVVQLLPSASVATEMDAVAASFAAATPEAVVAAVVAPA